MSPGPKLAGSRSTARLRQDLAGAGALEAEDGAGVRDVDREVVGAGEGLVERGDGRRAFGGAGEEHQLVGRHPGDGAALADRDAAGVRERAAGGGLDGGGEGRGEGCVCEVAAEGDHADGFAAGDRHFGGGFGGGRGGGGQTFWRALQI